MPKIMEVIAMKKRVEEMWRIHDVLFFDKEKAEQLEDGKETISRVFVGVDEHLSNKEIDGLYIGFFGSWVFSNKQMLLKEVQEFNAL